MPFKAGGTSGSDAKKTPSALGGTADDDDVLSHLPLRDGRVMSFNPFKLDPISMNADMNDAGLTAEEREAIGKKVKEEVVKALAARLEKWTVA